MNTKSLWAVLLVGVMVASGCNRHRNVETIADVECKDSDIYFDGIDGDTHWIGLMVYYDKKKVTVWHTDMDTIQIGLRNDGTVIWRKRKKP